MAGEHDGAAPTETKRNLGSVREGGGRSTWPLALAALGVVFGDIGTSPLYALRECFHGRYGIPPSPQNIMGVLSLIFWSLTGIVSFKYLTIVLRADNRGEGGVVALTTLWGPPPDPLAGKRPVVMTIGLFAAALLYGDGMITPAISVLSAVEGLETIAPSLGRYVVVVTIAILVGLFALQRHGTARIGGIFGPVMLLWFSVLALLGGLAVARTPSVLLAVLPVYALRLLLAHGIGGTLVLAAVFLVVTGAEALYADLGHFGRTPIRRAWFICVAPALLLNYFGQGALILHHRELAAHPFYALAPSWLQGPLIVLATAATVIASQALISGAFSLTQQAMQLGYLPRLTVLHTSASKQGQIVIPAINKLLLVSTVVLVLGFGSSTRLASAYGMAVALTMLITSVLLSGVAKRRWGWPVWKITGLVGAFILVDLAFVGANAQKLLHGAWFPLAIGGVTLFLLTTWRKGRALVARAIHQRSPSLETFAETLAVDPPTRVGGGAIYLSASRGRTPAGLRLNLRHNKVLHEYIVVLTVMIEEQPNVPRDERVRVVSLGHGIYQVTGHYGFMEQPNVPHLIALAREKGLDLPPLEQLSFVVGREVVLPDRHPAMAGFRTRVFSWMSRNAVGGTRFFGVPPSQVIEVGAEVEI